MSNPRKTTADAEKSRHEADRFLVSRRWADPWPGGLPAELTSVVSGVEFEHQMPPLDIGEMPPKIRADWGNTPQILHWFTHRFW